MYSPILRGVDEGSKVEVGIIRVLTVPREGENKQQGYLICRQLTDKVSNYIGKFVNVNATHA